MTYDELYHHGVRGQKWGLRRYQNPDGSLTEAGKKHYGNRWSKVDSQRFITGIHNRTSKTYMSPVGDHISSRMAKKVSKRARKTLKEQGQREMAQAKTMAKKAEKAERKSIKAERKGNMAKATDLHNRAMTGMKNANQLLGQSSKTVKKYQDVASGKLQAGRDYYMTKQKVRSNTFIPGHVIGFGGGTSYEYHDVPKSKNKKKKR